MQPLKRIIVRKLPAGTPADQELLGPVPAGQVWRITYLAVDNETGGNMNYCYRVGDPTSTVGVSSRQTPSTGFATVDLVELWMFPGDFLYSRFGSVGSAGLVYHLIMGEVHFTEIQQRAAEQAAQ
jgi:hypothetical protein